jgi:5-methylcytosine-specific restriction endonuclease McrA
MKKYTRTYIEHFGIGEQDSWICERCGKVRAAISFEIHHIVFRSHGGGDNIENLAALCHDCHAAIHDKGETFTLNDSILKR